MTCRKTGPAGASRFTLVLVASLLLVACAGGEHKVTVPFEIAGADPVGSETCAMCHDAISEKFRGATHALLEGSGEHASDIACESCHGAGGLHFESGGGRDTIINPSRMAEPCFRCHLDVRAEFSLPHAHAATDGPLGLTSAKMGCNDCHELHEGSAAAGGGSSVQAENDSCTSCHVAQRGPFIYEHEALREGCTVCHEAHGSPNAKMLTERNATLCVKCHFQEQTSPGTILIGGRDHSFFLGSGTCFSAGCHEAVHGSNVSSSLRF